MKALNLRSIDKLFISSHDVSRIMGISPESARVTVHRYAKNDILTRIKPNIFILTEKWNYLTPEDRFRIANILQVPSYISLTTALSFYGLTTQIQQNYIESVCLRKTLAKDIKGITFRFYRIADELYHTFYKKENIYIAAPEKALLDALYLSSLGRYAIDMSALDQSSFNPDVLNMLALNYPDRIKNVVRKYGFAGPS